MARVLRWLTVWSAVLLTIASLIVVIILSFPYSKSNDLFKVGY
jgi:heme exporter protein D